MTPFLFQAKMALIMGVYCFSLVTSSPLPAPMRPGAQWFHDYEGAAHGLTDAFDQFRPQAHQDFELAPLPQSLPWAVHDPAVPPSQNIQPSASTSWTSFWPPLQYPNDAEAFPIADPISYSGHPVETSGVSIFSLAGHEPHAQNQGAITDQPVNSFHFHDPSVGLSHPLVSVPTSDRHLEPLIFEQLLRPHGTLQPGFQDLPVSEQAGTMFPHQLNPTLDDSSQHLTYSTLPGPATASSNPASQPELAQHHVTSPGILPEYVNGMSLPDEVPLPRKFAWEPSPDLESELFAFLKSFLSYNAITRFDLAPAFQQDPSRFILDLRGSFRVGSRAYLIPFPSRQVFLKLHRKQFLYIGNTQKLGVSLWTIDQYGRDQPTLTIRGFYGASNFFGKRIQRLLVDVKYVVEGTTAFDITGKVKFLRLENRGTAH